jgi:hypothetical protein
MQVAPVTQVPLWQVNPPPHALPAKKLPHESVYEPHSGGFEMQPGWHEHDSESSTVPGPQSLGWTQPLDTL